MNQTKITCILVLLASAGAALPGPAAWAAATNPVVQVAAPLHDIAITPTVTLVSQYMFRGRRLSGESFQPAIEFTSGKGTVGIWSNFPIDEVPGTSDPEIDLYGSYNFVLSEAASIAPGFTWYTYPNAPTAAGFYRTTFEPSVTLSYTVAGLKLSPTLYYDLRREGPAYELTALYALPLKDIGSELDFIATVGTYKWKETVNGSSPATKAWGDYWLAGVSMPFQISTKGKMIVGLAYSEGRDAFAKQGTQPRSANTLAVGRGVVTLSYSHSF